MYRPFTILVAVSFTLITGVASAQQNQSGTPAEIATPTLASGPEAQEAERAMRVMEAHVESGVNFLDYSREVGNLAGALSALDEVLDDHKADALRSQVALVRQRYQEVKDLWGACNRTSWGCKCITVAPVSYGEDEVAMKRFLANNPELNKPVAGGGILNPSVTKVNNETIYCVLYPVLRDRLWLDARAQGRVLRSTLRALR